MTIEYNERVEYEMRILELEIALTRLLKDTQHSKYNCGDLDCPVDFARRILLESEDSL